MRLRPAALAAAALAVGAACASEGFPPGGPEDHVPPALVESHPADRAINATADQVIRLVFDEVIDEQQLRDLPRLVRVNPDDPAFERILDGKTIILDPQGALRDGVTYSVTILPGLRDRDGNATIEPRTVLFSVGGEEPITLSLIRVTVVRDTLPVPLAMYRLENEDEKFGYTMVADSQGRLTMEGVEFGHYVATAWQERVRPEGWQEDEEAGARDTFELSPARRGHETVYRISVRDTTAPVVRRVDMPGSAVVTVMFDDTLAAEPPALSAIRLWEAAPGISGRDVPLDSLPIAEVRGRRLSVADVRRVGSSIVEIDAAVPLERDHVYRIEIEAVNRAGTRTPPGEGRTFRAAYEGPRVFRGEPLAVPVAPAEPPAPAGAEPAGPP